MPFPLGLMPCRLPPLPARAQQALDSGAVQAYAATFYLPWSFNKPPEQEGGVRACLPGGAPAWYSSPSAIEEIGGIDAALGTFAACQPAFLSARRAMEIWEARPGAQAFIYADDLEDWVITVVAARTGWWAMAQSSDVGIWTDAEASLAAALASADEAQILAALADAPLPSFLTLCLPPVTSQHEALVRAQQAQALFATALDTLPDTHRAHGLLKALRPYLRPHTAAEVYAALHPE